jgi:hypothetical protein
MIPVMLDLLTIVCLVGGCVLLWFNLRPRRDVILTRMPDREDRWKT